VQKPVSCVAAKGKRRTHFESSNWLASSQTRRKEEVFAQRGDNGPSSSALEEEPTGAYNQGGLQWRVAVPWVSWGRAGGSRGEEKREVVWGSNIPSKRTMEEESPSFKQ